MSDEAAGEIKRAVLPAYLRHLASWAEAATPLYEPAEGACATVSVPVDAAALREAADELERLLALLRAIMDDTSDGQESMSFDIRDRIERALEPKP